MIIHKNIPYISAISSYQPHPLIVALKFFLHRFRIAGLSVAGIIVFAQDLLEEMRAMGRGSLLLGTSGTGKKKKKRAKLQNYEIL